VNPPLAFHLTSLLLTALGIAWFGRGWRKAGQSARAVRTARTGGLATAAGLAANAGTGASAAAGYYSMGEAWLAGAVTAVGLALVALAWLHLTATRLIRTGDTPAGQLAARLAARSIRVLAPKSAVSWLILAVLWLMLAKPPAAGVTETFLIAAGCSSMGVWFGQTRPAAGPGRWWQRRPVRATLVLLAVAVLATAGYGWRAGASRLPDRVELAPRSGDGTMEMLGEAPGHHHLGGLPVSALRQPATDAPVRAYTLTANATDLRLDGKTTRAWVFESNGEPNPVLHATQGDRLRITLVNRLPVATSIHWHGVDVPDAEDGVAGLTQDAVRPGATYTYDFVLPDAGTYWFHSHQDPQPQTARGLFGTLVVAPKVPAAPVTDLVLPAHEWPGGATTLGGHTRVQRPAVQPGQPVRLRLVATDADPLRVAVRGAAYRVGALDGHDVAGPTPVRDRSLLVPAGGRADLLITVPAGGCWLVTDQGTAVALGPVSGNPPGKRLPRNQPALDVTDYGRAPAGVPAKPTRTYQLTLDERLGFYDGSFGQHYTVNGRLYPHSPMLSVDYGDVVQVTWVNRSKVEHPMHLHGHHFWVVAVDGRRVRTPVLLDTTRVAPRQKVTVVFRADNPGIWMSHCHNFRHAAGGMDLMVAYSGYYSPYAAGIATGNRPE
jgi:FtsP/CotA-like multicopper oxidase with cupredoxin domain